ncbi:MAG: tetratricopeptide repeat protein [Nitrospiraceae bacterium]|nr:tetratricopeptide repeat protein [Nitrospiraceae bacterium]
MIVLSKRRLYVLSILLLLCGCGLPRIIVLDDPLTPEEHLNLGVSYEKKGEHDAALKEYKIASRHLSAAYLYAGNVYFAQGDPDNAEENYRKALERDPRNADACNNLAWLYYTYGKDLLEAERLALRALELNPAKAGVYQDTLQKIREKKQ